MLLALILFLAVLAFVGCLGRPASSFLRRRRRRLNGAHGIAEVVEVRPVDPPRQTEHPVRLRYTARPGVLHERVFTHGFDGIVPVPGWRVTVLFDPDDPDNAEITDNPYLHPVQGASPSESRRNAVTPARIALALRLLGAAAAVYTAVVAVVLAVGQRDLLALLPGLLFIGTGLWGLLFELRQRRFHRLLLTKEDTFPTTGVVTHTWRFGPALKKESRWMVRYPLPDGRQVHQETPMELAGIARAVGTQGTVQVVASRPTVAQIGSKENVLTLSLFQLLGGGLTFGLGLLILAMAPFLDL
ncbi:DUF3592 domain-containing protein [Nocardiopsis suaedae]|uniref:DUF3592 domain-containing protein n=1 Tax=Nocardiopsis suaedae TaxID=3018444 RepID=A0ABT4TFN8_9ACTN|nr:DUF3592 domain-containing protein [Nocardiopsis suaedae]MDA2803529.1 DUF3592 domain-containing protein [Nocardiopsis suaedae]